MTSAVKQVRSPSPDWGGAAGLSALAGLSICGFVTYGAGVYGFTQFLVPMADEFGWGRGVLGGLMSAFWMAAPFTVVAALAIQRFGVARVILTGALLEAAGLLLMLVVRRPELFFLCRFIMGAGKALAVTPIPIMLAQWFPRRTAIAYSLAIGAWHVGGFVFAPSAAWLVDWYGWRKAAIVLAAIIVAGNLIAIWLMRAPPSNPVELAGEGAVAAMPQGKASWVPITVIFIGTVAFFAGYSALLAQLSPLLADVGYQTEQIGAAMGSLSVFALIGCLGIGYVASVTRSHVAGAGILLGIAAVAVLTTTLQNGGSMWTVYAVVAGAGLMIGGGDPVFNEALRRTMPPPRYAKIFGWWYLTCLASLSAASLFAGVMYDWLHSYRVAFLIIAGLAVFAAALWWRTVRPNDEGLVG